MKRCRGWGCLIRESCELFNPTLDPEPDHEFIIERYSIEHGCPEHSLTKLEPVMGQEFGKKSINLAGSIL